MLSFLALFPCRCLIGLVSLRTVILQTWGLC